jgi:hypothetical protein
MFAAQRLPRLEILIMRRPIAVLAASSLLAGLSVVSVAAARGGPGGGGGGGGTPPACAPLATTVSLGHADGNGNSSIGVVATVRNCSSTAQTLHLNVSVPGSGTKAFDFTTALPAGASFTRNASPIGSTPLLLHFGQTYDVVATLTETAPTPGTLSTISTPVTMPPGVVS